MIEIVLICKCGYEAKGGSGLSAFLDHSNHVYGRSEFSGRYIPIEHREAHRVVKREDREA